MFIKMILIALSILIILSGWFLLSYKYVDMCDAFNQGGVAMSCYYGDKESCEVLGELQRQCETTGETTLNGWYPR